MDRRIRQYFLSFALVTHTLVVSGCATSSPVAVPVRSPSADRSPVAIARTLDAWHLAAANADEERYFSYFSPNAVFLGTDATERWELAAFRAWAHPIFARGKAWSFQVTRRAILFAERGDLAWFDEDLATPNMGPVRGSGVVVRRSDGAWKIAHYNLALTVPNLDLAAVKQLLEAQAAQRRESPR